jgi:hypothetical protein
MEWIKNLAKVSLTFEFSIKHLNGLDNDILTSLQHVYLVRCQLNVHFLNTELSSIASLGFIMTHGIRVSSMVLTTAGCNLSAKGFVACCLGILRILVENFAGETSMAHKSRFLIVT